MPRKPSPERIFRSHFPKATIERQVGNDRRAYFLVRKTRGDYMPIGDGDTKAKAWADACANAGLTDLAKPLGDVTPEHPIGRVG